MFDSILEQTIDIPYKEL